MEMGTRGLLTHGFSVLTSCSRHNNNKVILSLRTILVSVNPSHSKSIHSQCYNTPGVTSCTVLLQVHVLSPHFQYLWIWLYLEVACAQSLSHIQLFATSWTTACQASLSMGFPRQEYWNILAWERIFQYSKNIGMLNISFSRGSSRPRDRTQVSCIGRRVLHHRVTREAPFFGNKIFKEVSKSKWSHLGWDHNP